MHIWHVHYSVGSPLSPKAKFESIPSFWYLQHYYQLVFHHSAWYLLAILWGLLYLISCFHLFWKNMLSAMYADWGPPHLNLVMWYIFHLLMPLLCKTWFYKDCDRNCKIPVLDVIWILGTSNQAIYYNLQNIYFSSFIDLGTLIRMSRVEGCDNTNSQFVMIYSWDICTTWNVSKEGGLMTPIFLNAWIWFTCISLMVHICDKKRHLTLYIFRYVHGVLIPIMTAVTFEKNLTKKYECLHRNVRLSIKLIFM